MVFNKEVEIGEGKLVFESGRIARQANGSALISYEGSAVLATACTSRDSRVLDYLPLTVDYIEKFYAAGKIPGGFFKREGRPGEKEILTSRLIDRPIRPLFPKNYRREIQIIATTMSMDQINPPDVLAMNGASLALGLSDIPCQKLIGAVRVGLLEGNYIINPTFQQIDDLKLNLMIAGTRDAIIMVEGEALEASEQELLDGLSFAEPHIRRIIEAQEELVSEHGKKKIEVADEELDEAIVEQTREAAYPLYEKACFIPQKLERQNALAEAGEKVISEMRDKLGDEVPGYLYEVLENVEKEIVRKAILDEKKRTDGRGPSDIRPITIETAILPRTHGSALFTRGETQAIAITSLGTVVDEQRYDNIEGEGTKAFMLHYNFPPFSVGEVKGRLAPGRREIGHGNLAERAIRPMMPQKEDFPYTVRVVSEITESNGSSSMATVCASTLSLLSAGVPIKSSIAGVAMGLVVEGDRYTVLTDILGSEDHLGDMDFKVAGTENGITAFQMDVKVSGISKTIMEKALEQAREGRMFILGKMRDAIAEPAAEISSFAPKILTMRVPQDKIGTVIGPSGKMIRSIIEETGAQIWVEDDGKVTISSEGTGDAERAFDMVSKLVEEVEVGKVYDGEVKKIMDFGAFIEVLPGKEGLCHISQLEHHRVNKVTDVLNVGDKVQVKVTGIDQLGRMNLSRKVLLPRSGKKEE